MVPIAPFSYLLSQLHWFLLQTVCQYSLATEDTAYFFRVISSLVEVTNNTAEARGFV